MWCKRDRINKRKLTRFVYEIGSRCKTTELVKEIRFHYRYVCEIKSQLKELELQKKLDFFINMKMFDKIDDPRQRNVFKKIFQTISMIELPSCIIYASALYQNMFHRKNVDIILTEAA